METMVDVNETPFNNPTKSKESDTNSRSLEWLKINKEYFLTTPGKLKILEITFGIICMALAAPAYHSGTHWFLFAVTISFIGTLIWIFVYLLSIREALTLPLDWVLSEYVNTGVFTILYGTGFIVQLIVAPTLSHHRVPNIVAGVFGIFNTIVYSYATYLLHKDWSMKTP